MVICICLIYIYIAYINIYLYIYVYIIYTQYINIKYIILNDRRIDGKIHRIKINQQKRPKKYK